MLAALESLLGTTILLPNANVSVSTCKVLFRI